MTKKYFKVMKFKKRKKNHQKKLSHFFEIDDKFGHNLKSMGNMKQVNRIEKPLF